MSGTWFPNTFFVLLQRVWQTVAGVLTVAAVTYALSPAEQGWYYTFQSVAAIYILFDLGLSTLIVQVTAREALGVGSGPEGELVGEQAQRLAGFLHAIQRWFGYSALACWLLLPAGALIFHGRASSVGGAWIFAWGLLVLATSASQIALPWPFVLEGLGRIREAYLLRLAQGVVGSVLLWTALLCGLSIYSVAMPALASIAVAGAWLLRSRPGLASQVRHADAQMYPWKEQIAALHARTAVSWVAGYVLMHLYVPVLFRVGGAVAAGQLGLSLTVANMLSLLGQSWVTSRMPMLAQAAAKREWGRMDRAFHLAFAYGLGFYLVGAVAVLGGAWLISGTRFASRVLPIGPLALLLLGMLGTHVATLLATQVRAYRRDPFAWNSACSAGLTLAGVVPAALVGGGAGIVALIAAVGCLVRLPWVGWIYVRSNRDWRLEEVSALA